MAASCPGSGNREKEHEYHAAPEVNHIKERVEPASCNAVVAVIGRLVVYIVDLLPP